MLPALIVGALTAWYLGLRAGIIVAIIVAVAMFAAMVLPVPGVTLVVYTLVIAWAAVLYFLGPKLSKRSPGLFGGMGGVTGAVGNAASQAKSWANKILKRNEG
jgi:hypothetical protein